MLVARLSLLVARARLSLLVARRSQLVARYFLSLNSAVGFHQGGENRVETLLDFGVGQGSIL